MCTYMEGGIYFQLLGEQLMSNCELALLNKQFTLQQTVNSITYLAHLFQNFLCYKLSSKSKYGTVYNHYKMCNGPVAIVFEPLSIRLL